MRVRVGIACASLLSLLYACSACTGPGLEPPHPGSSPGREGPKYDGDSLDEDANADLDAGTESDHTKGEDAAR